MNLETRRKKCQNIFDQQKVIIGKLAATVKWQMPKNTDKVILRANYIIKLAKRFQALEVQKQTLIAMPIPRYLVASGQIFSPVKWEENPMSGNKEYVEKYVAAKSKSIERDKLLIQGTWLVGDLQDDNEFKTIFEEATSHSKEQFESIKKTNSGFHDFQAYYDFVDRDSFDTPTTEQKYRIEIAEDVPRERMSVEQYEKYLSEGKIKYIRINDGAVWPEECRCITDTSTSGVVTVLEKCEICKSKEDAD